MSRAATARILAGLLSLHVACSGPSGGRLDAESPAGEGHVDGAGDGVAGMDGSVGPPPDASSADGGSGPSPSDGGVAATCVRAPLSLLCRPLADFPPTLSETGLYSSVPDLNPAPEALPFRPRWELWSGGLEKRRLLVLPAGTTIDNRDRRRWEFPVGTLVAKTFLGFRQGREYPVETRFLRRGELRWEFAAYRWADDGSDAVLLALDEPTPVAVELRDARYEHQVPSRPQCRECHEGNATVPIGLDELRLNHAPEAGGPTLLAKMARLGLFAVPPPVDPEQVRAGDSTTEQILGYVHGNCANCHNGDRAFDLRWDKMIENTVRRATASPGTPAGTRVVPGSPDSSVLFVGVARTSAGGVNPMPPIGIQRRDDAFVALLREWITGLK